ncbi:MAG: hypothetical protein ACI9EF_002986 [Pseudohongiellaceae bacterium]|jgi:hypothetical protein
MTYDQHSDGQHHDDPQKDDLDDESLRQLISAWQQQPLPETTPELDDCDEETQAVVSWMAAAWAAQPIPAVAPETPLSVRSRRFPWPRAQAWPQITRRVAAALLLGGLTLTLLSGPHSLPGTTQTAAQPVASLTHSLKSGTPPTTSHTNAVSNEAARSKPQLVAVADDHIVFRSGPVRLVLITESLQGE